MFAAMRPAVKAVLGQMFSKPQNAGDYLQLAGRFSPELIFPLINAGMLPEGSSMGERFGAGAEALAFNLGGSLGGELLGGLGGRRLARSRGWAAGSQQAQQAINTGLGLGGTVGGLAANFIPMPITNSAYEQALRREQERQQAQQNLDTANLYTDLGGLGALAAQPLFDPRLLM
jgi:hypothetical protein